MPLDPELRELRNRKREERDEAFEKRRNSIDDYTRYKKLKEEYQAIFDAIKEGASTIEELEEVLIKKSIDLDLSSEQKTSKSQLQTTPQPSSQPSQQEIETTMAAPPPLPLHDPAEANEQPSVIIESVAHQKANQQQQTIKTMKMANDLIPEELDILIRQYLTDGVLTDKERQVILKKAEGMGLDRDEIDLYLDAEIQKIDQQTDATIRRAKGKVCPYCGAPVPQLADKCPECEKFITPEASEELKEIVDNLEDALVQFKSGEDVAKNGATIERYARKAKLYYSNNPKIKLLLAEVEEEMIQAEARAKSLQRSKLIESILTNRWTYIGLLILLILSFIGFLMYKITTSDNEMWTNIAIGLGAISFLAMTLGTVAYVEGHKH